MEVSNNSPSNTLWQLFIELQDSDINYFETGLCYSRDMLKKG